METLLGKYLWVLDLLVVGLCAAILGLASSNLVESRYVGAPRWRGPLTSSHQTATEPRWNKRPDAILRRNIFCSTCPPILLDGDPDPNAPAEEGPPEPRLSELPLTLVAVMYAPSPARQAWNMAVIRDEDQKTFGAFGVGAEVHGAKLVSILGTRVYLKNEGAPEFLDLLTPPKRAPAAPARVKPPPRPRDRLMQELDRGIKKIAPRRYEVKRSALESVMGNLALLSRSARIVPDVRAGKPHGLRLVALRPDGPLAKLGLERGDVIVSINGQDMANPEKALLLYGKLKSANQVALGLERGGKKVSQDYTIR